MLLIVSSCQKTREIEPTSFDEGIRQSEQVWGSYDVLFLNQVKQHYLTNSNQPNAKVAASTASQQKLEEFVVWTKSMSFVQKDKRMKAMVTPIGRTSDRKKLTLLSLLSCGIDDQITSYKLKIQRTNERKKKFSGTLYLYNLNNELISEVKYDAGKKLNDKSGGRAPNYNYRIEYHYDEPNDLFRVTVYGGGSTPGGGHHPDQNYQEMTVDGGGGNNGSMSLEEFLNSVGVHISDSERTVLQEYPFLYNTIFQSLHFNGRMPNETDAYKMYAADQANFPKFTEIVKGLPAFVGQHENVKQALVRHTNLSWNKIEVLLRWGTGPQLVIMDLRPQFGDKIYGHTTYPGYPEGTIQIQSTFVAGLEQANLTSTRQATAFLLAVTLLHEMVHYGAVDGAREETSIDEFGNDFEREILKTVIDKENAFRLRYKFYNNK